MTDDFAVDQAGDPLSADPSTNSSRTQMSSMDAESLVAHLDQKELMVYAPPIVAWKIGAVESMEGVAQFMYRGGPRSPQAAAGGPGGGPDVRPEKSYWDAVKSEMHVFLCTDDKKYKELWKRVAELDRKSTSAVVGIISAYLGSILGVAGALLAGFVAVCLYAVAKLGKEAYCRYMVESGA